MKALKVLLVLVFVFNAMAAFAEGEVASDCSQIQDSTSRTGEESSGSETVNPSGTGATGV